MAKKKKPTAKEQRDLEIFDHAAIKLAEIFLAGVSDAAIKFFYEEGCASELVANWKHGY